MMHHQGIAVKRDDTKALRLLRETVGKEEDYD